MKYLIVGLLVFIGMLPSYGQQKWKLAKSDQGIEVYTAEVINSKYVAFKATMLIKTTEQEVFKILKNIQKYPEWLAYTASVSDIQQTEYGQSFVMETDYPWPYSNECMKYSMSFQRDENKGMKVNISGTQGHVNCKYTIKKAGGYILLEPDQDQIRITYYFHSEPSQNIPSFLLNSSIYKMPFQTFLTLKKKLIHF
mgnify:CR=1 FL=1